MKYKTVCLIPGLFLGFICIFFISLYFTAHFAQARITQLLTFSDEIDPETHYDALYVLGGNQQSLLHKYIKTTSVYKKYSINTIILLSRPGITTYSQTLGRNFTNDEWSLHQLTNLGISANNIEFISPDEGFFGTITEAKAVANLSKCRDYRNIILVTNALHTKRTKISFTHYANNNVNCFVVSSHKSSSLSNMLNEFIKFIVYKIMLI